MPTRATKDLHQYLWGLRSEHCKYDWMTLANQQQKAGGVIQSSPEPSPNQIPLTSQLTAQTDQSFCTHPGLGWAGLAVWGTIFYVFQICTGISLSLFYRQTGYQLYRHQGTILNRALMRWDCSLQIFTPGPANNCEGQTDQTHNLTWTPSSRGWRAGIF